MITGKNYMFIQSNHTAFGGRKHFHIRINITFRSSTEICRFINKTEFKSCCGSENFLGTGGILDTRKFDHDTVCALSLNQRFGNTQFVHTVTDNGNILLNRTGLEFLNSCIGKFDA